VLTVVAVAQLVESRIVIPAVVGSSPIGHPTFFGVCTGQMVGMYWIDGVQSVPYEHQAPFVAGKSQCHASFWHTDARNWQEFRQCDSITVARILHKLSLNQWVSDHFQVVL
jgi:hypothetical protein